MAWGPAGVGPGSLIEAERRIPPRSHESAGQECPFDVHAGAGSASGASTFELALVRAPVGHEPRRSARYGDHKPKEGAMGRYLFGAMMSAACVLGCGDSGSQDGRTDTADTAETGGGDTGEDSAPADTTTPDT